MEHEEIVKRFIEEGAVNFDAIGSVVSELGPDLALSEKGFHGVVLGKPMILACFMPIEDLARTIGQLRGLRNLESTLTDG